MKTNTNKNKNSGLLSRPEQVSTPDEAKINFKRRKENRSLNTEKLLELLRTEAPRFFEIAEVVGKWVWIQFAEKQPKQVTRVLAELGFHWNSIRQTWQHPCGADCFEGSAFDPRKRYGSYFAADVKLS